MVWVADAGISAILGGSVQLLNGVPQGAAPHPVNSTPVIMARNRFIILMFGLFEFVIAILAVGVDDAGHVSMPTHVSFCGWLLLILLVTSGLFFVFMSLLASNGRIDKLVSYLRDSFYW
jgi:hypothetical protein